MATKEHFHRIDMEMVFTHVNLSIQRVNRKSEMPIEWINIAFGMINKITYVDQLRP